MLSEIKALVKHILGSAYDPIMPLVGIPLFFLYPRHVLYWPYILTSIAAACGLYLYLARKADRSARGFLAFLVPKSVYGHYSAGLDLKYFLVNSVIISFVKFSAFAFMVGGLLSTAQGVKLVLEAVFGPAPQGIDPSLAARLAYSVVFVMGSDFGKWLAHFLQHKVAHLWDFHKLHHSAQVLTPLTNLRVHPVDVMLENFIVAITTALVAGTYGYVYSGGIVDITIMGLTLVYFLAFIPGNLRHSHIPLPFPRWLSHVFSSPLMHQVHHSYEKRHWDMNYAVVFSLWDTLFRTNYIPAPEEQFRLGIGPEGEEFRSVFRLYFYPFRALARRVGLVSRIGAPPQGPALDIPPAAIARENPNGSERAPAGS